MTRLRANFVGGSIAVDLTNVSTSLQSNGLSLLPAVTAPDIAVVVLDPDALFGAPEIVYVTAHTAGNSLATILRGQEGTSGRVHLVSNGIKWRHGPTKNDWDLVKYFFNAKEFNAVGDGATDDTAALQNWINIIPVGGVGYLPYGTYNISSTLIGKANVSLEGLTGPGGAGPSITQTTGNTDILHVTGFNNFSLSRILFRLSTGASSNGLVVNNCTNVFVDKCQFDSAIESAGNLGATGVKVTNSSAQIFVTHTTFGSGLTTAITGNLSSEITVDSCLITENLAGIAFTGCTECLVSNNLITTINGIGINIVSSTAFSTVNASHSVIGNLISGCGIALYGVAEAQNPAISIQQTNGAVVNDNVCILNFGGGIETRNSPHLSIVGNVCVNNGRHGNSNSQDGIKVSAVSAGESCTGTIIAGNSCTDYQSVATQRFGINVAISGGGAGTGVIVALNSVYGNTQTNAISIGGGSGHIVRSNSGYVTENTGAVTITSGNTTVTVTHGLNYTPVAADIQFTPTQNPTNDPGHMWVSGITSTQFVINCRADPGASNLAISWAVRKV